MIGGVPSESNSGGDAKCTEVMAPVALSERSPLLLLMGGGIGAGKSTVLKDILEEYSFFFLPFTALLLAAPSLLLSSCTIDQNNSS